MYFYYKLCDEPDYNTYLKYKKMLLEIEGCKQVYEKDLQDVDGSLIQIFNLAGEEVVKLKCDEEEYEVFIESLIDLSNYLKLPKDGRKVNMDVLWKEG